MVSCAGPFLSAIHAVTHGNSLYSRKPNFSNGSEEFITRKHQLYRVLGPH